MISITIAMAMVTMTTSSRILLIPAPHYSHVNMFAVAAKTLQENGHDVSVLVPDILVQRVNKASVTVMEYPVSENAAVTTVASKILTELKEMDSNILYKGYYMYNAMTTVVHRFCRELLGNKQIMEEIRSAEFDLAIVDSFNVIACIQYVPYKFDIPRINLGPLQSPWMYGVSSIPFHEPPAIIESRSPQLNLMQRVVSVMGAILIENVHKFLGFEKHAKEFLPEKPMKSITEIMNSCEMMLVTVETNCFDFPRISAPHYRFIGSLSGSITPKVLPEELKKFADNAKDGLIIISFGSLIDLRKTIVDPIHMLIEAIGRMKEKAILQFTLADLGDSKIPPNILVQEWLPQTDLLAHKNTKLFVAHGGLNGHLEATYFGVPILTLPYQPEQAHNGARAEAKGHGKLLKWDETNANELYDTMREIIDDKSYKENIVKCKEIIKDIPSAREQLSFWVNHVLKHGSKHLRPISADMPFYQFFGLDVLAIFISAFLIVVVLLYGCCRCCVKCCCRSSKIKKD